ncbi:MAG: hypothetical protein COB50_04110 [Thiotrichales bacterium]|nr:MAG: hypothetical protein COB50_04110 [Thiotrichales bacterium]
MGHLVSIGFSENNFPSVGPVITGSANALTEGMECTHYFIDEGKETNKVSYGSDHHTHKGYIPNLILKVLLTISLINVVAALWDCAFDKTDERDLKKSFKKIYNTCDAHSHGHGHEHHEHADHAEHA